MAEAGVSLSQLDVIAYGCGPGAFTGVRIASGVAQGIAFACDLPAAPVSTLANLVCQSDTESNTLVLPAIDARMNEIYWAVYKKVSDRVAEPVLPEKVQQPESIDVEPHPVAYGLGSGWQTYCSELQTRLKLEADCIDSGALPRAKTTALIGQHKAQSNQLVDAMDILPVYLRDQVAHKKS